MHSSSSNLYANFPPTPICLQPSESKCSFFLEPDAWLRKFEIQSPMLPFRPHYHSGHGQLKLIRSDFCHFPVPTGGQIASCFTTIWTMFHRKYHHRHRLHRATCWHHVVLSGESIKSNICPFSTTLSLKPGMQSLHAAKVRSINPR